MLADLEQHKSVMAPFLQGGYNLISGVGLIIQPFMGNSTPSMLH